jgi:cellulose biosynthesis protein BcsQ
MMYFVLDNDKFYALNCNSHELYICNASFDKEQAISMQLRQEQNLDLELTQPRTLTSEQGVKSTVMVNKNMIDFFNDYPSAYINDDPNTCWAVHANTPLEQTIKDKLYPDLKKAIAGLAQHYDYVIVDTEPHLGILSINALTASDRVIIPTQADVFSLQGIKQLWQNIRDVKESGLNPSLSVDGLLLTRYNKRALLSQEVKELLATTAKKMETRLYKTAIRENISVKESQLSKASIFKATPKSNAATDYESFILEFLQDNSNT